MKSVTIDNLDLKDHVRWANDQDVQDPFPIRETLLIAPHVGQFGDSAIYASKFDELFELQRNNLPWATFATPEDFFLLSRRLFSHALFPSLHDTPQEESDDAPQEDFISHLTQRVISLRKRGNQPSSFFEKDKTVILSLLESIKTLNDMLQEVNARKQQFQKG
jgi:hypothetical protein